ncbi:MAG TPA: hypothetical protein VFQ91_16310 [Bryobacteraceae bacterium]|nr:hypothetical protein [Bryobacteraceae bacterium]
MTLQLPFGLTGDHIPEVTIRFRVASTKVMSGYDEIIVRGAGEVELQAASMADAEPAVRRANLPPAMVERLLGLLRAEGVEGWDEEYPSETRDYVAKLLTVERGDLRLKQVAMCRQEFAEFSRVYGALKLVASLATPEVLTGDFFQRI